MKKRTKIILSTIIVIIIAIIVVGYITGSYFYSIAIDATVDNGDIFAGSDTQNNENGPKMLKQMEWFETESNYKEVYMTSRDNLKLHAYEILNKEATDKWVIDIHGYQSSAKEMTNSAYEFLKAGYNVLMPNLRGHGESEGNYIGMGWDDRLDIIDWANEIIKQNPNAKIVLYGVSMGGATVMMTTGEELPSNIKVAIEDCGYTSIWDEFSYMLKDLYELPDFPALNMASLVTRIKAGYFLEEGSAIKQVAKSKTPTLFIHGKEDKFVPYSMLEKVYEAASCEKQKLEIEEAEHALSASVNPQLYWTTIFEFINKHL